jgi:hypothetical protein
VLALAGGCSIETRYTPRTPGRAALGIQKGEPALYKDGVLSPLSTATPAIVQCSPPAAASAAKAADHHASYRSNLALASVMYALGVLMPPVGLFGAYFGSRAAVEQQEARASLVDAINQHNDEPACGAAAAARAGQWRTP